MNKRRKFHRHVPYQFVFGLNVCSNNIFITVVSFSTLVLSARKSLATVGGVVQWILEARASLDKVTVINAFRNCPLTAVVDGSEDGQIHCFQE